MKSAFVILAVLTNLHAAICTVQVISPVIEHSSVTGVPDRVRYVRHILYGSRGVQRAFPGYGEERMKRRAQGGGNSEESGDVFWVGGTHTPLGKAVLGQKTFGVIDFDFTNAAIGSGLTAAQLLAATAAGFAPGSTGTTGTTIPTGTALQAPTTFPTAITIPGATTFPAGFTAPARTVLKAGSVIPAGTELPAGTVIPAGTVLPDGTKLAQDFTLTKATTLPAPIKLPTDTKLPATTTFPAGFTAPAGSVFPAGTGFPAGTVFPPGTTTVTVSQGRKRRSQVMQQPARSIHTPTRGHGRRF